MSTVEVLRGNRNKPLIAFYGMNPGQEDVRQGVPFVGPPGKLLSSYLKRVGIDEAQCCFSNIVRSTTPNNREPTLEETKAWRNVLISEIQTVQPKVIVPLGNFALKELTGSGGISKRVGIPTKLLPRYAYDGTVIPTYHPAYILRNRGYDDVMLRSLAYIWAVATSRTPEIPLNIVWVDKLTSKNALKGVVDRIQRAPVLAYDIETNARMFSDPEFGIYLIAISIQDWTFVFGPSKEMVLFGATLLVPSGNQKCVGHNAIRFDAPGLAKLLPALSTLNMVTDDTMLLDYYTDENSSHGLESVAHRHLGVGQWKNLVTWSWATTPASEIPWETAVEYVAKDAATTLALYHTLLPKLTTQEERLYQLLRGASITFSEIEKTGVYLDLRYTKIAEQQTVHAAQETKQQLQSLAGTTFNPTSSQQLLEVLSALHIVPMKRTPSGKASTDEESIKLMRAAYPAHTEFFTQLLHYRLLSKRASTYFRAYRDHPTLDKQQRIHPSYGLTTTVSGRTSSFKPNFENIPREPLVRRMIAAPPGKVLLSADYSQLELRIAAEVAQEPSMLAAFQRGDDLHALFAQKLVGRDQITKEERYAAKVANFLLLYGGEESTLQKQALLQYNLHFSHVEAKRYRTLFHEQWPGLESWYAATSREILETGQIVSFFGQTRRLPDVYANDRTTQLEALRSGLNFTVQNPAAIIGITAASLLVAAMRPDPEVHVVGFVHDSVMLEIPEVRVEEIATKVIDIMERHVLEFLTKEQICRPSISVNLRVDIEAGPSWGDMTKMKSIPKRSMPML